MDKIVRERNVMRQRAVERRLRLSNSRVEKVIVGVGWKRTFVGGVWWRGISVVVVEGKEVVEEGWGCEGEIIW